MAGVDGEGGRGQKIGHFLWISWMDDPLYKTLPNLLSLQLKGEETFAVVSVGPCTEKFNVVSNDHGHSQKCGFSVLDRKYPFWRNLVQKIKIVSLSWNLVPRLIRICIIQHWCFLFLFSAENTFLVKCGSKIQNCLFKVKFGN